MSRTDKDLPYWYAENFRPNHHWRCIVGRANCSLPKLNVSNERSFNKRFTACYWQPIHEPWRNKWWSWQPTPPKWFLDHVWNNAQRVHERDTLRDALKDYNANGDTDIQTLDNQHRHCGQWLFW